MECSWCDVSLGKKMNKRTNSSRKDCIVYSSTKYQHRQAIETDSMQSTWHNTIIIYSKNYDFKLKQRTTDKRQIRHLYSTEIKYICLPIEKQHIFMKNLPFCKQSKFIKCYNVSYSIIRNFADKELALFAVWRQTIAGINVQTVARGLQQHCNNDSISHTSAQQLDTLWTNNSVQQRLGDGLTRV